MGCREACREAMPGQDICSEAPPWRGSVPRASRGRGLGERLRGYAKAAGTSALDEWTLDAASSSVHVVES